MGLTREEHRYLIGESETCPESMKITRPKVWEAYVSSKNQAPVVLPKENDTQESLGEE